MSYGYLNIIGAETGDLNEIVPQSNVSLSTFARTGTYSFAVAASPTQTPAGLPVASFAVPEIASNGTFSGGADHAYYLRFYAYLSALPEGDTLALSYSPGWSGGAFGVNVNPNGSVQVNFVAPGSTGISSAGVVAAGQWIRFDTVVTPSLVSDGRKLYDITIFINGSAVAWTTGGALGQWNPGYSFSLCAFTGHVDNITVYFDDIALTQNQRAMSGGVLLFTVNSDGEQQSAWYNTYLSNLSWQSISGIPATVNPGLVTGNPLGTTNISLFNINTSKLPPSWSIWAMKGIAFFTGNEPGTMGVVIGNGANFLGTSLLFGSTSLASDGISQVITEHQIGTQSPLGTSYLFSGLIQTGAFADNPTSPGSNEKLLAAYLSVDGATVLKQANKILTGGRLLNSPLRTGGAL